MATPQARDQNVKNTARKRDNMTCQKCGQRHGPIEGHHVEPKGQRGRPTVTAATPTNAPMTPLALFARARYGSIKAFAAALGCSPAKAGMICQGRHINCQTPDDVRALAAALDASYQEVVHLLSVSYRVWSGREPPEGWIVWDPAKPETFEQVQWERRVAIEAREGEA